MPLDYFEGEALRQLNKLIAALEPNEILYKENCPEPIYHASIGIGSTALKKFDDCPARFIAYEKNNRYQESPSKWLGSALHCYVLEPELFHDRYRCLPSSIKNRNSNAFRELQGDNPNVYYFSDTHFEKIHLMGSSIIDKYAHLLRDGKKEFSCWRRDPHSTLVYKCRIDCFHNDVIFDLKTAESCKPHIFQANAARYGYHIQDALYSWIVKAQGFGFIVVENSGEFLCELIEYDPVNRQLMADYLETIFQRLRHATREKSFPGYAIHGESSVIELPYYINEKISNAIYA